MSKEARWDEEADVVVVGFGGAGATAAIVAHDAGARVLILEKQPADTATVTRHTPSTRMCGGGWFGATDAEKAARYLEGMVRIANETLDTERREMLAVFAQYLVTNNEWMKGVGVNIYGADWHNDGQGHADFSSLPGAETVVMYKPQAAGTLRHGAALFKSLSDAVQSRGIGVLWEAPATHLVTRSGEVVGVEAMVGGKAKRVKANRAVVLTCGGFEFSDFMKENYLRVNPVHFYGNPGNTGDGVNLSMEIGAALWHMNDASWRVTMKFPDFPLAFGTQYHETASLFVDRFGRRFTSERFNMHAFGYELTPYDARSMCYPRVPSFWIFGESRRALCALASQYGACNPPGGVSGDIHYVWSADNRKEIERGWIVKANNADELAGKLAIDADVGGLMKPDTLKATLKQYDEHCRKGEDPDFHKAKQFLQPLEAPPYYAVKLWPGGPNTHGGPKRNVRAQVVRTDNTPVPRLYSAGELGSVWGMLYQGGGDIAECIAFGRIAGANAALEKIWK